MVVGMNYSQMYQYLEEVPASSSKGEIGQISEMTLQILDVLLSTANNSLNTQAVGLCVLTTLLLDDVVPEGMKNCGRCNLWSCE